MTVRQMRLMLKGLPGDLEIQIPYGEGMFRPVCNADSGIIDIQVTETDPETLEVLHEEIVGQVLMLMPCLCNESSEDAIEELAISSLNNPNSEQ